MSDPAADRPGPDPGDDEVTEGAIPVPAADPTEGTASVPVTPPVIESPAGAPAAVAPSAPGSEPSVPPTGPAPPARDAPLSGPFPADRPERKLGAAFAGGLLLAVVLRRLAR